MYSIILFLIQYYILKMVSGKSAHHKCCSIFLKFELNQHFFKYVLCFLFFIGQLSVRLRAEETGWIEEWARRPDGS